MRSTTDSPASARSAQRVTGPGTNVHSRSRRVRVNEPNKSSASHPSSSVTDSTPKPSRSAAAIAWVVLPVAVGPTSITGPPRRRASSMRVTWGPKICGGSGGGFSVNTLTGFSTERRLVDRLDAVLGVGVGSGVGVGAGGSATDTGVAIPSGLSRSSPETTVALPFPGPSGSTATTLTSRGARSGRR